MNADNHKYYLIPGLGCLDPAKDLPYKYRIAIIPDNYPFVPDHILGHNSLRHLRKYDENWRYFDSVNHKGALKICEHKFLLDFNNFILTPSNSIFDKYSHKILMHSIFGEFEKELSGVHLLSSLNKNLIIEKVLRNEDSNMVWEAQIKVFNEQRQKHYSKISTFFPKFWTPSHFMFESFSAFTKIYMPDLNGLIESKTNSGVPVKFVFNQGILKSVFPIYINN
jgi:hypothetical protein